MPGCARGRSTRGTRHAAPARSDTIMTVQHTREGPGDLIGEERWNGVAHLNVLLRARAMKEVVVRKRLETCYLSHGEAPALTRIRMNEVVAVLRQVTRDRCARPVGELHPVSVVEMTGVPVRVARHERIGEIEGLWRSLEGAAERRCE